MYVNNAKKKRPRTLHVLIVPGVSISAHYTTEGVTVAARWQDDWRAVAADAESDEEDLAISVAGL